MKILVCGDIIIDKYTYGSIDRLAPDFLGFVFDVGKSEQFLGGAGNTAKNIAALMPKAEVHLAGSMDPKYDHLLDKIILHRVSKETLVKERIIATGEDLPHKPRQKQKVIRVDYGKYLSEELPNCWPEGPFDYIIIADYNKGTIAKDYTPPVGSNTIVFADTKDPHKKLYNSRTLVDIMKINNYEFADLNRKAVPKGVTYIVTHGSQPVVVWEDRKPTVSIPAYPAESKDSYDIDYSGAGDSFLAGLVYGVATHGKDDLEKAVRVANVYAAMNIVRYGVTAVSLKAFTRRLKRAEKYWSDR